MTTKFEEKIYQVCKKIPKGKVSTYKVIAEKLNSKAYRAVGSAMNKNPYSLSKIGSSKKMVPCHRVVASNGHLHGFAHGLKKKAQMLRKEGLEIKNNKIKNFKEKLCKF
ncbi:MGMT family protein [Candidatus Woesearchaeota archaeon]|nr:MGMT family protein [Candidatus Woesearchaeota archaeon]